VQELLVASFSESHGVRAEVEVVAAGCAFGVVGVLDVDPALLVVPAVADGVLVLGGVHFEFVALVDEGGVVHDAVHDFLVDGLLAAALDLLGGQQHVLHAAVLVARADLHVVQDCVALALDLDVVDELEEDAAVLLDGLVLDLELALDFVLLGGVGQFVSAQHVQNLALQDVLVGERELLAAVDVDGLVAERDGALGQLVAAAVDVHAECGFVLDLGQVLGGVDEVHGAVECVQHGLLDVVRLVQALGADQTGCHVVLGVLLLGTQLRTPEADDHAVLDFVLPVGFDCSDVLGDLLVLQFVLGVLDFLEEAIGAAGLE